MPRAAGVRYSARLSVGRGTSGRPDMPAARRGRRRMRDSVGSWFRGTAFRHHREKGVITPQPVLAIQWLCSFSRLWVAVVSRHSDLAAALPLRKNRSIRRLNLICPNTGSIVVVRCW